VSEAAIFRENPRNTAGLAGSSVTLRCRGSQDEAVLSWLRYDPESNEWDRIATGLSVYTHFTTTYNISKDENKVYYLTLLLNQSSAAKYACEQFSPAHSLVYATVACIGQ
jgi:hypothetical protein